MTRKVTTETVYQQHGWKDRAAYIADLCEDYEPEKVMALADVLGPEEDFDGLLIALEDDSMASEAVKD